MPRRTAGLVGILAAALIGGTLIAAAGQEAPYRSGRRFRTGVDVISITATVVDADGTLVAGLGRDDFELFEDGESQPITQFTADRVPVGLGLLLDVSDSMFGQRLRDARAAVERFLLELLGADDEYFVLAFNHEARLLTPWTSAPDVIRAQLDGLRARGGTAIYDAVLASLPVFESRRRQRAAIVLISDGADTASDATLRQVRAALLRSDAFVYAVAIDPPGSRPINARVNPYALRELTDDTGGRTEVVHDTADLGAATARIATELNSQYVLGYSSTRAPDARYHSIRLKVKRDGLRVRARRGYVAGEPTR